ncbi:hypothetical protein JCM5353_005470 [Sporobolomyces roseus]
MIPDLIQQDSDLYTRQCAVAALSRVNKHFYSIYASELFLKPMLTSENQAIKWGKSCASRVNPWTVKKGGDALKDVFVPIEVTFSYRRTVDSSVSTMTQFPRPINPSICVSTPFTAFFFRTLTSFAISTLSPIVEETLASLFGPGKPNRNTIRSLSLCAEEQNRVVNFLLEGIMHLEFEGWDGCFEGPSNDEGTDQLEDWEKHTEDGYDISHEEWERRDEIGRQKALFDYSIYKEWDQIVGPHFSNVIGFPCSSDYPFHKLETLSLRVDEVSEWYLIFSTDSFPSLRYLKLLGIFCDLDGIEYIVSTWRYSVIHRSGRLLPPSISNKFRSYADDPSILNTADWVALPIEGDDYVDKEVYRGPHLDTLDLAELRLIAYEEAE